jgi:hypothetical protein
MKSIYKNSRNFQQVLAAISILALLGSIISCKKFVEIPPPTTEIVTASVFNNDASANSAQLNIYNEMENANQDLYFMSVNNGLLGDELTSYSTNAWDVDFYTNAMNVNDINGNGQQGGWQNAYNYIYQANAVTIGLQGTVGVTAVVKQQLTGEALFVRAFWYFHLTNCYGDVPLALTSDYTVTSKLSRIPRTQVLQQVINDLILADSLLSPNYLDATDTAQTPERVRPNKPSAEALLARAYLYLGDYSKEPSNYSKAEQYATSVIGNSLYALGAFSGPNRVFLKNSTEAIWQLQVSPANLYNGATPEGYGFILLGSPNGSQSNTISPQLLNSFETGDNRRSQWIDSLITGNDTFYFPYKYQYNSISAGGSVYEYTMVLRLAEQYLIRAEAEADLGDLTGAATDLNIIRNRAGLPNIADSIASSQPLLLAAILHERQVELFTECGHRWFDLNRTGNINAVMSIVTPLKGGVWISNGNQTLYPIPKSEIAADPNLTQNPGY